MTPAGARIMVIDDDASLLSFTCKYLMRLGYTAVPFSNSEKAWESFVEPHGSYILVVLDLSMPGISGRQLPQMILEHRPDVRLILTSGYPIDTRGYPDSVAFLHKPFSPAMLTETVRRLIGGAAKQNAD